MQFGLRSLLFIVFLAAVLVWLWPRSFTLFGHAFLATWVALTLGFVACAVKSMRQILKNVAAYSPGQVGRYYTAFTFAVLAAIAPTACLGFFRLVFGGGGSNVAQLAASGGMDLWSIWYDAWPPLFLLCPISVLVNLLTYAVFFRPRKDFAFFVMRLCGLGSALISTWVVTTHFPDA